MIGRSATIFKWSLYAAAAAACFLLQGFVLRRITLLNVTPFLAPLLAALAAMWEGPLGGMVYALALGVCCDLALPVPIPCFHTLAFPAAAFLAAWIAKSALPAGKLCALAAGAAAFALTDLFHILLLVLPGKASWGAAALVAVSETCVTLAFLPAVYPLFWWVHRKTHLYD